MCTQFIRVHLSWGPPHNGLIHAVLLYEHRSKSICASEIHHSLEHAQTEAKFCGFIRLDGSIQLLVVTGKHKSFGELGRDPTRRLNRLRTLVNNTNVKHIIKQLGMNELTEFFIGCRCQSAAYNISLAKYLIDMLLFDLFQIFFQQFKLLEYPNFFTFAASFL